METAWRLTASLFRLTVIHLHASAGGSPEGRRMVRTVRQVSRRCEQPRRTFVKFPVELFDVIPGIGSARIDVPLDPVETEVPEDFQSGQEGSGRAHHTCPRPQAASRG